MSLSAILRRSAFTVVPIAARIINGQRYNHQLAALFSAVKHRDLTSQIFPNNNFSSNYSSSPALNKPSPNESLIRVLNSEIECAEEVECDQRKEVQEVPAGFAFEIEDNPGQQTITLSREYHGETINIEVEMASLNADEEENEDDDEEKDSQSCLPMIVRVSKKHGASLEFGITAFPDEITIDSLSIKGPDEDQTAYEGPRFHDLDENLQKGFHKYLESRGIKPSITSFLHEYMVNKDNREYKNWLRNLKDFVEA